MKIFFVFILSFFSLSIMAEEISFVADFNPTLSSSSSRLEFETVKIGNNVYFLAVNQHIKELWVTDGTKEGTRQLVWSEQDLTKVGDLKVVNEKLVVNEPDRTTIFDPATKELEFIIYPSSFINDMLGSYQQKLIFKGIGTDESYIYNIDDNSWSKWNQKNTTYYGHMLVGNGLFAINSVDKNLSKFNLDTMNKTVVFEDADIFSILPGNNNIAFILEKTDTSDKCNLYSYQNTTDKLELLIEDTLCYRTYKHFGNKVYFRPSGSSLDILDLNSKLIHRVKLENFIEANFEILELDGFRYILSQRGISILDSNDQISDVAVPDANSNLAGLELVDQNLRFYSKSNRSVVSGYEYENNTKVYEYSPSDGKLKVLWNEFGEEYFAIVKPLNKDSNNIYYAYTPITGVEVFQFDYLTFEFKLLADINKSTENNGSSIKKVSGGNKARLIADVYAGIFSPGFVEIKYDSQVALPWNDNPPLHSKNYPGQMKYFTSDALYDYFFYNYIALNGALQWTEVVAVNKHTQEVKKIVGSSKSNRFGPFLHHYGNINGLYKGYVVLKFHNELIFASVDGWKRVDIELSSDFNPYSDSYSVAMGLCGDEIYVNYLYEIDGNFTSDVYILNEKKVLKQYTVEHGEFGPYSLSTTKVNTYCSDNSSSIYAEQNRLMIFNSASKRLYFADYSTDDEMTEVDLELQNVGELEFLYSTNLKSLVAVKHSPDRGPDHSFNSLYTVDHTSKNLEWLGAYTMSPTAPILPGEEAISPYESWNGRFGIHLLKHYVDTKVIQKLVVFDENFNELNSIELSGSSNGAFVCSRGYCYINSGAIYKAKAFGSSWEFVRNGSILQKLGEIKDRIFLNLKTREYGAGELFSLTVSDEDFDGDLIPNEVEESWGLDPYDPTDANQDLDSDGVSNGTEYIERTNLLLADTDRDGISDLDERSYGTNPLDYDLHLSDVDQDGLSYRKELEYGTDPFDADSDDDGVSDFDDAFPLDPSETLDSDDDGLGNNVDTDDDNDGVVDEEDDFPLDDTETLDTDGDGIGNNADTDDDNDGVSDSQDAFPLDPSKSSVATEQNNTDSGDGGGSVGIWGLLLLVAFSISVRCRKMKSKLHKPAPKRI